MSNDYNSEFNDLFETEPRLTRADVREEVSKTLRDINTFAVQAQAGISTALEEVRSKHPDFESQRPRMLAVLEQIPLLRDAVISAEGNPQLSSTLPQIYEVVYRAAQAPAGSTATASEPSKMESQRSDLADEGTQYQAALASQRVNLSAENRKNLITSLESKGVLDVEF